MRGSANGCYLAQAGVGVDNRVLAACKTLALGTRFAFGRDYAVRYSWSWPLWSLKYLTTAAAHAAAKEPTPGDQ